MPLETNLNIIEKRINALKSYFGGSLEKRSHFKYNSLLFIDFFEAADYIKLIDEETMKRKEDILSEF